MPDLSRVSPLVKVMVRYGLISGAMSILASLVFFYIGKHPFWIFPFFDPRVLLIAIFLVFGLKEVRDYFHGGILYFWQGLGGSLVMLVVMSVVGYCGVWIFATFEPDFLKDYIRQGLEQINNIPAENADEIGKSAIEEARKTIDDTTVGWMAKRYAIQTYLFGFFIAVIISVVLRKHPSLPQP
jgi:hypothetical protein